MKPTVTLPAVTEPTLEERVVGLTATVTRLAEERYTALKERDAAAAIADVHIARANRLATELETACTELRRATARCRELAAEVSARDVHIDQLQRELAQANHRLKQREKRWPFSRTGNQF